MSDPHIRAAFYLSPTLDSLWRWSADGETLVWADDRTIAFRAEVEAVLRRLAPGGLPPFGAVALLLAACREGWPQSLARETIAGYTRVFAGMKVGVGDSVKMSGPVVAFGRVAREIDRLLAGLDAVNRLPPDVREGVPAKTVLAEAVFEGAADRGSQEDADLIILALDEGVNPETLRARLSSEDALAQFAQQVDGMRGGLSRIDAKSLARRAKTGLEESVQPAEADLSPPERVRRLLAELREDPEHTGLARLAHDLMAAVSVPRTLRYREELAVGGVSDLTNRGPLDRLLVSELAHDDLTLAVRVAVNEALYLRRECPPREPPHRRAILLDAGIRMWGVPRVFAAAVAMALSANNDPHAELIVFRATGAGDVDPVDLTTRRGLDAHLAALESSPHPGAAVAPFFAQLADSSHGGDEPTDALIITHADVLADPAFLAALHAVPAMDTGVATTYVAAVDRDGYFRLVALTRAGQKLIREAELSLDVLLNPPATRPSAGHEVRRVKLLEKDVDPSLPAIFYADPFPFLLPHVADPKLSAVSKRWGLVAATDDGRLLQWSEPSHVYGARQVTSKLPRGSVRLVHPSDCESDYVLVLIARAQALEVDLVIVDLPTGLPIVQRLETDRANFKGAFVRRATVFLVCNDQVLGFDSGTGACIGELRLWNTRWLGGRYFQDQSGNYLALADDGGTRLLFESVPFKAREATAVFDRDGFDGPHALRADGSLVDTTGAQILAPDLYRDGKLLAGISPDGQRLLYNVKGHHWFYDLEKGTNGRGSANVAEELLAPEIFRSTRSLLHPRTKFSGVFVDEHSRLMLRTRNGRFGRFDTTVDRDVAVPVVSFVELTGAMPSTVRLEQRFHELRRSASGRIKMHVATWNDGSRIWLDGRGILHFKSSDASVPEFSIAITNSGSAAWSADGALSGCPYLLGDDAVCVHGAHFLVQLNRFVERLR